MTRQTEEFEIDGVRYVNADILKRKEKIGENALAVLMRLTTFPVPKRIGRVRFFNPAEVKSWFKLNNKE